MQTETNNTAAETAIDVSRYTIDAESVHKPDWCSYPDWRSLYPVREDGAVVAFLGYPNGWAKGWQLCALELVAEGGRPFYDGCRPRRDRDGTVKIYTARGSWQDDGRVRRDRKARAQDRAIEELARIRAGDRRSYEPEFATTAELVAARDQAAADRAARKRNYLATMDASQVERRDRLEGLESILARHQVGQLALRNSETVAIEKAIGQLIREVAHYDRLREREAAGDA